MAEPTSQWGKDILERMTKLEQQVANIVTIGKVTAAIVAAVLGIAAWVLTNVVELKGAVAVVADAQKKQSEEIKQNSTDIRAVSDAAHRLDVTTNRLQTIVERLEKVAPPPPPRSDR